MGCIFSKFFSQKQPQSSSYKKSDEIIFTNIKDQNASCYEQYLQHSTSVAPMPPEPELSLQPPPIPPKPPGLSISMPAPRSSISISQNGRSRVQLYTPIYIAIENYSKTKDTYMSFELGDEMELIEEINSLELHVNHLRSGLYGIIPKNLVQLNKETPLRLAVNDAGIIQQCLMQYNVPGAYLIRRSATNPEAFVLSILQFNEKHNTLYWHYLICINQSNNCFYFAKEETFKNIFFSSFQKLINDERVRNFIPLTDILPDSIEFEEEIWKIPFDELNIEYKIGEGQFGEVFHANWHKEQRIISVAVKKLHVYTFTKTIKREIEVMKKLTNLYIVTLYGISQNPITNEIFIVTELMENGDLKTWLKNLPNLPEYSTLLRFSRDISSGMTYLEYRNYVHRDLACRNILLGTNGNLIKIADLGLSIMIDTDQRQEAHSEKLPIRWLAPELLDNQAAYSIKSDVWSFGILLIELWLKGGDPYGDQHLTWISSAVSTGYVHEKPLDCPVEFYESIICQCLKFKANDRPSFTALRQLLEIWQC
ncbi:unnamed protein product [Rotaria sordida]|uniref:non-specific protein-tyrosine kinase n=1 Tax=Rotaria sordida TaxID=392033 RepID=A0A814IAQ1_9BILA|nr:unnamed protein product [Rotaria sordida]CAF1173158.1 unnamed protein product [Rotaria sordida]CAF3627917.1 unnamed protein product [Rotaria sordida]CAF3658128.1 unnamed protein product [Rotaria sordida]